MILEAIESVFLNGVIVEKGSKFSCSPEYATKLIKNKAAILAKEMTLSRKILESKTKEELIKLVEKQGIDSVSEKNKKDEIIDALLEE